MGLGAPGDSAMEKHYGEDFGFGCHVFVPIIGRPMCLEKYELGLEWRRLKK
jgi:hypothetical protein